MNTRTERIDRTISSIIGGLENLTVKLPAARAHLIAQIRITGEPASTPTDATTVTHTSELTPVEAAANNRAHLQAILDDWSATLDAIALQVTHLNRDCDRAIGTRTPGRQTPRCDGGINYRGYIIPIAEGGWSNPGCHDTPSEGKTCDNCEQRASMWARRNPKTRHADTAA
jgi:hypothetical protein